MSHPVPNLSDANLFCVLFSKCHHQSRLALDLMLWRTPVQTHRVFPAPLRIPPLSRSHFAVINKIHVYPFSRHFGPKRTCWNNTCFCTTNGERKPCAAAPEPLLMSLQQTSPEQSTSREIRKLIVRLLVGVSDLRTNKLPGGTSILSKPYWDSTRYDPLFLTKHPSDRPEGVVCDKGKDRHTVEVSG